MQKLILGQGDVAPVPQATLTDVQGNPLNLAGTHVRFKMINYLTKVVIVDAGGVILQNTAIPATFGQVAYYWMPADTSTSGLYQAWFTIDWGNGPQHFPPDNSWFILINPAP